MAGIYIHIPFCKQACTYCNFHFSTSLQQKAGFLDALETEIGLKDDFTDRSLAVETIYFGGGTPSLLSPAELGRILGTIRRHFMVSADAEITIEANPDDISRDIVAAWMDEGINRVSLGVQSFDDDELRWMNRAHSGRDSRQSLHEIQEAGIRNISADLIFGSPLQPEQSLVKNIKALLSYDIPHLSCYALTVEPRTALHKRVSAGKTPNADPEIQAKQFMLLMALLEENGYEQYEISNYAKAGMRSRHNSSYWHGKPYYGFGPSAHSYNGKNIRRWNAANNARYIRQLLQGEHHAEAEILTETQMHNEYIMTALRTCEGIDCGIIDARFGKPLRLQFENSSRQFLSDGRMQHNGSRYYLTREGKLFADGIAAELFV